MKRFFVKYFVTFFSIFLFLSCSSLTNVKINDDKSSIENSIKLDNEYYALERDYNELSKDKTNDAIVNSLFDNIIYSLGGYDSEILKVSQNEFKLTINNLNIRKIMDKVNTDPINPIIYYNGNDDNQIHININKDNYMGLSALLPILNNETFYAYTAEYNQNTSREEFKKLIAYSISAEVSESMEKSTITLNFNDGSNTKTLKFSILDFLLLHEPIIL